MAPESPEAVNVLVKSPSLYTTFTLIQTFSLLITISSWTYNQYRPSSSQNYPLDLCHLSFEKRKQWNWANNKETLIRFSSSRLLNYGLRFVSRTSHRILHNDTKCKQFVHRLFKGIPKWISHSIHCTHHMKDPNSKSILGVLVYGLKSKDRYLLHLLKCPCRVRAAFVLGTCGKNKRTK